MKIRRIITIAKTVWLEALRRKDVYVLLILLGIMIVAVMSLDIFGLGGVVGYVKDVGLLAAWFFGMVVAITISTRQLPDEEKANTIFPLLAKPVTRAELLTGKWAGATVSATIAMLACYLLLAVLVKLKGGAFEGFTFLQCYLLHAWAIGVICAIGILFSTRLNKDAAATLSYVTAGAAFLLIPQIPRIVVNAQCVQRSGLLVLYYIMPHLELFDMRRRMVHDWGPASWSSLLYVMIYGLVLIGLLLVLSWLAYRRKVLSRADLF